MDIDYDFMASKYQALKSSSNLIFLKDNDLDRFNIEAFNQNYQDAKAKKVVYQGHPFIFIKKIKLIKYFNQINREADASFAIYDYDKTIKLYEKILLNKKVGTHVYARLGLAYLAKNNHKKALEYLVIATCFSLNKANKKYDFTNLINKIIEEDNKDRKKIISLKEFKNDLEDFYGITRIKEVLLLINYQGMSVKEASEALNLSIDEVNKIYLVLAKECFALYEFTFGDKYLLQVENNEKTREVKKLIEEIRKNRIFYHNRIDDDYKPLVRERRLY